MTAGSWPRSVASCRACSGSSSVTGQRKRRAAPPVRLSLVAQVDPYDDEIEKFVVHRYAYDPARRQRRHMVVAAFDNPSEFEATIDVLSDELRQRQASGEDVDPRDYISGVVLEPMHHRKQRAVRIITRAIEHGATLDAKTWEHLLNDLPPNMAVMRFESDPEDA